ncbi:MAG: hypothetical protein VX836_16055 [Pseudomonadota bacterium]|nr:hypothetical protein [Pseudomonadota bacterium]
MNTFLNKKIILRTRNARRVQAIKERIEEKPAVHIETAFTHAEYMLETLRRGRYRSFLDLSKSSRRTYAGSLRLRDWKPAGGDASGVRQSPNDVDPS